MSYPPNDGQWERPPAGQPPQPGDPYGTGSPTPPQSSPPYPGMPAEPAPGRPEPPYPEPPNHSGYQQPGYPAPQSGPPGYQNQPPGYGPPPPPGYGQPGYGPPPPPPGGMSTGAIIGLVIGALVILILLAVGFFLIIGSRDDTGQTVNTEPPGPETTFLEPTTDDGAQEEDPNADIPGDGTYLVGQDIQAGEYRASVPEDSYVCYWERLSDTTGEFEDIITNGIAEAGEDVVVTIEDSDRAFGTEGCGSWTRN